MNKFFRPTVAAIGIGALIAGCSVTDTAPLRALLTPGDVIDDSQIATDIRVGFGVHLEPALDQRLDQITAVMDRELIAAGDPFSIEILDQPARMAFIAPGRRLFVTRGLLPLIANDSEAAALIGLLIAGADETALARRYAAPDAATLDDLRRVFPADTAIGARMRRLVRPYLESAVIRPERRIEAVAEAMLDQGWDADAIVTLARKLENARAVAATMANGARPPLDFPSHFVIDVAVAAEVVAEEALAAAKDPVQPRADDIAGLMAGLPVGPSGDGSALRNGVFTHAGLGLSMRLPAGATVLSEARAARIFTPQGARILIEGIDGLPPTDHMAAYLRDRPARTLDFINALRNVGEVKIGPFSAGVGEAWVDAGGGVAITMAALRLRRDSRMYEAVMLWPGGLDAAGAEAAAVLASIRPNGDRADAGRLEVAEATAGGVARYAPALGFTDAPGMLFAIHNGLRPGEAPPAGATIMVVRPR